MSIAIRRVAYAAVLLLAIAAISRTAQFRFQEKQDAIYQACRDQLQKLGMTKDASKAKYPTPEIHMVSSGCLLPGSTGEVVVKGKFAPETKFLFASDNVEVVKESLAGGEYRAAVKVAAGVVPQMVDVIAITPVTGITARSTRGAAIGGRFEWTLQAANGWKIVGRSPANKGCGGEASPDVYAVEFFRDGEAAPFEKRQAKQDYSMYENLSRIRMTELSPMEGQSADFQSLMTKMSDPKLPSAEREKLMQQLQKAQADMQANMKKFSDPAYIKGLEDEKKKFGCESIQFKNEGGKLTGEMRCAPAVGMRVAVTGSLKFLGR